MGPTPQPATPSRQSSSSSVTRTASALDIAGSVQAHTSPHEHQTSDSTEANICSTDLHGLPPHDSLVSLADSAIGPVKIQPLAPCCSCRNDGCNNANHSEDPAFGHNLASEKASRKETALAILNSNDSNDSVSHDHRNGEAEMDMAEKGMDDLRGGTSEGHSRTCTWAELPPWMKDNPAIRTGYRRPTLSYRKSIASLWYLHNESVNIWSHLLGAVTCLIVAPIVYFKVLGLFDTAQWTDVAVFYGFIAGAIICLTMSASFHTFCCHSEVVSSRWLRCDYVGIVFLIVGSFYPAIYYGFYCYKMWQIIYTSLITFFGIATVIVVFQPKFRTPQFRWVRSGLFLALGLSGLVPIGHGIVLYGFRLSRKASALDYMFGMGGAYVIGVLLYGSRTPECLFPGKFDNFMASHQIFHICVLIGCGIHFLGVYKAMEFWHLNDAQCTVPLDQLRALVA
ncbi:hypothetical protein BGW38_003166 [Lunasporangiospora selenospora]|uniref:Hemolysin III n=1 Tax=Lunasporangiospora selenospora TaxID=979761 RepID=A0A9P6FS75_9FUNG|nr:hypothetical protein BGW38_003166 [Lunasporangiospora selenospora]